MLTYNTILTKIADNNSTIKKYNVRRIGFGSDLINEQKIISPQRTQREV